jgi:iron complex transport system substrate-binding protein
MAAGGHAPAAETAVPGRVVSLNLCTDQLAMMIAAPGQLYSVSHVARDPRASAMASEADGYEINHGLAEEIYLMRPDLVLTGTYTRRTTTRILRRLGITVEEFDPARSLDDVRQNIARVGEVLGRPQRARNMLRDFDRRLEDLRSPGAARLRAATYHANGYTAGQDTLAGRILSAAGLINVAVEAGYPEGGVLPLEILAMALPDLVVTSHAYPGASRSEEIMAHPVVRHLQANTGHATLSDHDWVCGTPHVLRAIGRLSGHLQ